MARVSVLGVSLLENPSPFGHPLRFQVQFECGEALPHGEYAGGGRRISRARSLVPQPTLSPSQVPSHTAAARNRRPGAPTPPPRMAALGASTPGASAVALFCQPGPGSPHRGCYVGAVPSNYL